MVVTSLGAGRGSSSRRSWDRSIQGGIVATYPRIPKRMFEHSLPNNSDCDSASSFGRWNATLAGRAARRARAMSAFGMVLQPDHPAQHPFVGPLREEAFERHDDSLAEHADAVTHLGPWMTAQSFDQQGHGVRLGGVGLVLVLFKLEPREFAGVGVVRLGGGGHAAADRHFGVEVAGLDERDSNAEARIRSRPIGRKSRRERPSLSSFRFRGIWSLLETRFVSGRRKFIDV
jgi:hypothetical protein